MKYFSILKSFFQRMPYVIFFVTAKCNSRCRMCFYWKNLSKKQDELTLYEIHRISQNMGNLSHLSVSGGEPFLRDDLDRICYLFYKNNQTRFITIPTNGILSDKIKRKTEMIVNLCPKSNISISLSLDAYGKKHDYIRGVEGNFKKLLKTHNLLVNLKKHHPNLRIYVNTVVSSFNKESIEELISFVKCNLDVDRHIITVARGNTRELIAKEIPRDLLERLYSIRTKGDMTVFQRLLIAKDQLVKKLILKIIREKKMPIHCLAGKKMIIITETGVVYPCEILTKSLGNLRDTDYNLKRILSSKRTEEVLKFIKNKKCYCTFECGISASIIYSPTAYPSLLKCFVRGYLKDFGEKISKTTRG